MKILLISPEYPPPLIGGSLVYINNLIENSGLSFSILTEVRGRQSDKSRKYIESKYLINSGDANNSNLFRMYGFMAIYILKNMHRYDLVIFNISAIGNGFFAFFTNLFGKKSMIISFAEELTLAVKSKGIKGILKRLFIKGYRKADMNISISHFAKEFLINEIGVSSPIHVIPTPVHTEKLDLKKVNNEKRDGILSVGRLVERKGHILVLKAFKKVYAQDSTIKLTIIGDGPEYPRLKRYINDNSLQENVNIHRNVSDDFLRNQYSQHEIFILANLMLENGDCEGAPNVLIEAAAYGLPSIAGEEGGTSDVVEHNKSGYLLDPKDIENLASTITLLLADKPKIEKMRNYAINKALTDHDKVKAGRLFRSHILNCIES